MDEFFLLVDVDWCVYVYLVVMNEWCVFFDLVVFVGFVVFDELLFDVGCLVDDVLCLFDEYGMFVMVVLNGLNYFGFVIGVMLLVVVVVEWLMFVWD